MKPLTPLILRERRIGLQERMDDPQCDLQTLFRTYDAFDFVNRRLAGWRGLYNAYIRPHLQARGGDGTLLDVGAGGGDVTREICRWAMADGLKVSATALDLDERALAYAKERGLVGQAEGQAIGETEGQADEGAEAKEADHIVYRTGHTKDLIEESARFDFVITNHVLHHLTQQELTEMCQDAESLCHEEGLVLFNDIHRSDLGYGLFGLATWGWFAGTFIQEDGLRSIRRSFTADELRRAVPSHWTVMARWPFRVVAMCRGGSGKTSRELDFIVDSSHG
ncbi:MAG: methyltransferase domain-containing protein [Balneolaceae bacterium]|nr:methyltransferase domain-containing protein [Balneolaceae bacterium]